MNYVITGSLGNISKPIVEKLIAAGHQVNVVTSSNERAAAIEALGAKALVGSVTDAGFINAAFKGAETVYTMVPPAWHATDWKNHIGNVGKIYADAIAANGITHVVNLSSIGAHLPEGVGPVSGLYKAEQALNALENVNVLHLRPGYFYSNFFAQIGLVKNAGILGSNAAGSSTFVLSSTADIAAAAADALLHRNFSGKTVQYLASDEKTAAEIAQALGNAIGKPELPWVEFTDEQNQAGLVQAGLSEEVAKNYTEMGAALRTGAMAEDYYKNEPLSGQVKLGDFAKAFAQAYQAN